MEPQEIQVGEVTSIKGEEVHVTRVDKGGGVYGHKTSHCDEAGCNGVELYYGVPEDQAAKEVTGV